MDPYIKSGVTTELDVLRFAIEKALNEPIPFPAVWEIVYSLSQQLEAARRSIKSRKIAQPKHILETPEGVNISQEQYDRIRAQAEDIFGKGEFILLEGGLRYAGMTHEEKVM